MRQGEEVDRSLPRPVNQFLRDAVPGDQKEADLGAGTVDLTRHVAYIGGSPAPQWRQIDGWKRAFGCRHMGALLLPTVQRNIRRPLGKEPLPSEA